MFRSISIAVLLILSLSVLSAAAQTRIKSLSFKTEPGAAVYINDVLFGHADAEGSLKVRTAWKRSYSIRTRAFGFKDASRTVPGSADKVIEIMPVRSTDEAELALHEAIKQSTVDREKSIEAFKKAIKLRPRYIEAQIGLARVLADSGAFEEADRTIKAVRKSVPLNAEAAVVEGRILKLMDEESDAIAAFKRAIRNGKGHQPEAYTGLGLLYKERAERFGAESEYEKETEAYTEAAKDLKTALDQLSGAPDSVIVYQLLGLVFEQQKKAKEAISVYEEFLMFFPDHPETTAFKSFIVQLKRSQEN